MYTKDQAITIIQLMASLIATDSQAGIHQLPPHDRALALAYSLDIPKPMQQALLLKARGADDEEIAERLSLDDPGLFLDEAHQAVIRAAEKRLDASGQRQPERLSLPKTAKAIREVLARRWPGITFYVGRVPENNIIYVTWQDGPTQPEVDKVCAVEGWGHDTTVQKRFRLLYWLDDTGFTLARSEGTSRDHGIVPSLHQPPPEAGARLVHPQVELVYTVRTYSPAFVQSVTEEMQRENVWPPAKLRQTAWRLPGGKKVGERVTVVDVEDKAPGSDEQLSDLYWQALYTRTGGSGDKNRPST